MHKQGKQPTRVQKSGRRQILQYHRRYKERYMNLVH